MGVVSSIKSISLCLTLNRDVTNGQPRNTSFYFRNTLKSTVLVLRFSITIEKRHRLK